MALILVAMVISVPAAAAILVALAWDWYMGKLLIHG